MSRYFDPSLEHLSSADFVSVYEPAEDSHLLLDALHTQRPFLSSLLARHPAAVCLEVGSGSGLVISFLSNLQRGRGLYLATDINPQAAKATCSTMKHNHSVLLFNPPYVPTPSSELLGDGIQRAWAGGARGREVLDRLLQQLDDLLAVDGVFYCVLLRDNEPEDVRLLLHAQGLDSETVMHRKAGREQLQVVKAWRRHCKEHT